MDDADFIDELEAEPWSSEEAQMLVRLHFQTYELMGKHMDCSMNLARSRTVNQVWSIEQAVQIRVWSEGAINERHLCKKLKEVS